MNFTFGIITSDNQEDRVKVVIDSILSQNIKSPEIVVVGGKSVYNIDVVKHVDFDETIKSGWITKKKNLITENATQENIVYLHDYVKLNSDWYSGFLNFGYDWDVCMTKLLNEDGSRYRDWCAWDDPNLCYLPNGRHWACIVPYGYSFKKHMYISGAYWVAKKEVMEKEPLNENLCWGESEDVEWSFRMRDKYNYQMNIWSSAQLLKQKDLILLDKT